MSHSTKFGILNFFFLILLMVFFASFLSISKKYTSTPCSQRCSTIEEPIPEAPPEIKALLVLIIVMTLLIYYSATKNPWKVQNKLPKSFFLTLLSFLIFVVISKTLDFFLAISALSVFVSYYWGEKRIIYLLLVGIIFPVIVFVFFETILGLRFPPGIITNIYYS